ncbi:type II toxin-antitoxin system death-on-curing family toxin [Pedobacter psychrodurus]|uniref:Type II toxin-antitoxin system death-on-curing family toxin n=1 Tax=Pedobacter psychrodurus TaxID=2530456 RepID=A0A4R0Q2V6_9SPHI|nr:type II toxin-antitoxin system death-on-curing family toxin [Pedobacter psychrodurus]TCD29633.1 type II toxin-antitoxin system death-on-curing family toxin [Pedobacter psychrodurus]
MGLFYFDLSHAVKEHDFIIEKSGGRHGYKDLGLMDSVLEHMTNDIYYPEIHDKAVYLCFSIIKNHAFVDGNKRSSIVLTSYFLEINGLDYCITKFIREMENYAVYVAANFISKELLYAIISSIIYEHDYQEELKVEIALALANQLPDDENSEEDADDDLF